MADNLYDYAIEQSRKSAERRELMKVSSETGLDYSWLTKFSLGKIPGASFERVNKLATYYQQQAQ